MATAAAAVVAKARRNIISHFMAANAVSPDSAIAFSSDRRVVRQIFDRFVAAKVVLPTPDGRYYLDVPAWDAHSKSRRGRVGMLLGGVAVAAGAAVVLLG